MTSSEFKRIGRLLKRAYTELEEQAVSEGIDIASPEYISLVDKAREVILSKSGFTLDEYKEAKAAVVAEQKPKNEELQALLEKVSMVKGDKGDTIVGPQGPAGKDGVTPNKEEIIQEVLKRIPIPKDGVSPSKDEIIKEVVALVPKPKDGVPGLDGTNGESFDPKQLDEALTARLKPFEESLPERVKEEVGHNLKAATEILGMPNWRKLAMGLQGQIDVLSSLVVGSTGFNIETPTGTVNGVNTSFTVGHTPKSVIIDGLYKVAGNGYSYAGGTITTDADNPPVVYIRSIY